MDTLLVIDSNYLCWRSMLGMPNLSWEEKDTAIIFGFLRQLLILGEKFKTNRIAFAWDSKRSYRKDLYSEYKANRKDTFNEDDLEVGKPQFRELRTCILPTIGFFNSFLQTGIEADDIMAQIVSQYFINTYPDIMLVTADNDMYQMLRTPLFVSQKGVDIYNPATKKLFTAEMFSQKYGIIPHEWKAVKAIAGCS